MLKVFNNIINNPTQLRKYGNLNFGKMKKRLSSCKPAFDLLILSGFKTSENDKKLIWTNTNNNMEMMKSIHDILVSMNITNSTQAQIIPPNTQQPQLNLTQMITNMLLNNAPVQYDLFDLNASI